MIDPNGLAASPRDDSEQQWERSRQLAADLAAGMMTSAVYTTAMYPVHRVKILLQTQDVSPHIRSGNVPRFSFLKSFGRLIREQGFASLWQGNMPYVLRHTPSITMSFAFKDAFRDALPSYDPRQQFGRYLGVNVASGALSGAVSLAIVYPFDLATVRMAADLGIRDPAHKRVDPAGMWHVWRRAVSEGGLPGLYRGFGVSLAATLAYKSLYFGLYDTSKGYFFGEGGDSTLLQKWVLASATVYTSATITYPLDVLRKRLVVDAGSAHREYSGLLDAVRKTAAREGVAGFYRFYGYDMLFRVGAGLLLVVYDEMKRVRDKLQKKRAAGKDA